MYVFEELHGSIFIDEEKREIDEAYAKYLEEKKKNAKAETETEAENENGGDVLGDNFSNTVNSISKNKKSIKLSVQNLDEKTKDTSTLIGRKTKELTGTGKHGSDGKDNQRDKKTRNIVSYVKGIANAESIKCNVGKFDDPNIKKQFGSSFAQNMSFLNTKFYKIICFQKDFKVDENDNIIHRDKGLKNKNIIIQMLKKEKNELFVYLMKVNLSNYEEIGEEIKKHLPLDENDEEKLNFFKDNAKSLIEEIKSEMKKARKNEFKPVDYITIKDLED